jgi:hypothetical protein
METYESYGEASYRQREIEGTKVFNGGVVDAFELKAF